MCANPARGEVHSPLLVGVRWEMQYAPLFSLLLLVACSGKADDSAVVVPAGLDPLEDNAASLPSDETVNLVSNDDNAYHDTNARGRILAAIGDVTACVQNPDVGVDRRRVASYTVTNDVNADYPVSYAVLTNVEDVVNITYTITWLQGDRGDGTYGVRWSKTADDATDANANLLTLLEGSVLLQPIDGTSTDVGIIEHLQATMTSTADTEQFTGDFYASLVACAHGDALPTY